MHGVGAAARGRAASDRIGQRKPFLVAGYGLSGVCKTRMAFVAVVAGMLGLRFGDRVGQGAAQPAA